MNIERKEEYHMKVKLKQFIYILVVAMFILITVFPVFWALVSSLRSDEEIFRYAMPFRGVRLFLIN